MTEPLGKYMVVNEIKTRGTTRFWEVLGSDSLPLGFIKWYGAWRCYTFWPNGTSVLNATCLDDLAKFTRSHTTAHLGAARTEQEKEAGE